MRKIEQDMIRAIKDRRNWRRGNTRVIQEERVAKVWHYETCVAEVAFLEEPKEVWVSFPYHYWRTPATLGRMRAIAEAFGAPRIIKHGGVYCWEEPGYPAFNQCRSFLAEF